MEELKENSEAVKPPISLKDIDAQIASLQKEINLFMQKVFETQGALKVMTYMRENYNFDEK